MEALRTNVDFGSCDVDTTGVLWWDKKGGRELDCWGVLWWDKKGGRELDCWGALSECKIDKDCGVS